MNKLRAILYLLITRHWVLVISHQEPAIEKTENGGSKIVAGNSFNIISRKEKQ